MRLRAYFDAYSPHEDGSNTKSRLNFTMRRLFIQICCNWLGLHVHGCEIVLSLIETTELSQYLLCILTQDRLSTHHIDDCCNRPNWKVAHFPDVKQVRSGIGFRWIHRRGFFLVRLMNNNLRSAHIGLIMLPIKKRW